MTDEEIVALYWARSESAIAETDRQYGRYCRYIAASVLQNDADAEEIVNDTYFKAWNCIPPERPNPLRAFLGRITRQLSLNRLEHDNAEKRGGGHYAQSLEELEGCLPSGADQDSIPDRAALADCLDRFLRSLTDEDRRLFLRRYWYMIPVSDRAREMKCGESRVKSRLMRLREKLRAHLEKEDYTV